MEYFNLGAPVAKSFSDQAIDFRIGLYPDGSRRIQEAYPWRQGCLGGVVWKDIPMVPVDHDGVVLS